MERPLFAELVNDPLYQFCQQISEHLPGRWCHSQQAQTRRSREPCSQTLFLSVECSQGLLLLMLPLQCLVLGRDEKAENWREPAEEVRGERKEKRGAGRGTQGRLFLL